MEGMGERRKAPEGEGRLRDELAVGFARTEQEPDDGHEEEGGERQQNEHGEEAVHAASREHQSTSNSLPRQTRRIATSRPRTSRSVEIAAALLNLSCWKAR